MAELIRKDKLIDWTYRVPQYYDSMNDRTDMRDFINGLPTTTESEIRAKAISEFAKRVRHKIMSEIDECADELEWITEIEWQMKEEQKWQEKD